MMKFVSFPSPEKRPRSDACVVPFAYDDAKKVIPLFDDPFLLKACHRLLSTKDFVAKEGEVATLYPDPVVEDRLIAVGLGDRKKVTAESLRASFASVASRLSKKQVRSLSCILPCIESISHKILLKAVLQGLYLGSYAFNEYISTKEDDALFGIREVAILTEHAPLFLEVEHEVHSVMSAVSLARDLVNRNADQITPEVFAEIARSLATDDLRVTVHGKEWIECEQMGLLLAVAQGARYEPRFVIIEWKGAPDVLDTTVLIGKGITFDSGGLDLKAEANMQTMKEDMAGAATTLAVMQAVRDLRLALNVTAVIPLCENAIGPYAFKPGDVIRARSGKTVEILSTDAEGRLILADALDYARSELQPSRIIDVATLTGSASVALGNDISVFFSNTDSLAYLLEHASHRSGDPVWRLPLYLPYEKLLDSDIADCKNVASRTGGAINAAVFLNSFVGNIPWAHFDIAGTAFLKEPFRYYGKGATGVPVRTLIEFFQSLALDEVSDGDSAE